MSEPASPMAAAMQWVARIMAAALMMVLPGLLGQWLDERWGVNVLALTGFAVGIGLGLFYLIAQSKQAEKRSRSPGRNAGETSNTSEPD